MLVDESKYNWSKWQQPILTSNDSWGEVSASSVNIDGDKVFEPYFALDGDESTHFEGVDRVDFFSFTLVFEKTLKI